MNIMSGNLYRALKSVNVPEDLAQKAAEDMGEFHREFAKIHTDLTLLKWMVGIQFAGTATLILKAFF